MTNLLSVITVVKNDENNIEQTIKSVLNQKKDFPFEYIVLDGNSSDKTFDIISKYKSEIDFIKSQDDNGMYYALNEGVKIASGKYIGILHSGDLFNGPNIISKYKDYLIEEKYDLIFSNLQIMDKNKIFRFYDASYFQKKHILMGWCPPHPTCFIKKTMIEKANYYDTRYRIGADFDLLSKLIFIENISFVHLPIISVFQRRGGISDKGLMSKFTILKETIMSLKRNNLFNKPYLVFFRYFIKIREVIIKK